MLIPIYHTTENRGNEADIVASKGILATQTKLFLGRGYYYWEGDFEMARQWGISRYNGNYSVFGAEFDCNHDKLFNLKLNIHLAFIHKLKRGMKKKDMPIGMFIDFLIDYQNELLFKQEITEEEVFFPFWYGLAEDYSEFNKKNTNWFTDSVVRGYYSTNPCNFFCIYDSEHLTLNQFRHLKSNGEVINV